MAQSSLGAPYEPAHSCSACAGACRDRRGTGSGSDCRETGGRFPILCWSRRCRRRWPERSISSRPSGCVRLTCRLPSRSRCSRNGAPARVNSFGPCKRQSRPRPRRRRPDQPWLFTAARWSYAKFGIGRKALRNPVDSATAGVFLCVATSSLSGRPSFDLDQGPAVPSPLLPIGGAASSQNCKIKGKCYRLRLMS
jgi:hypothetical protein